MQKEITIKIGGTYDMRERPQQVAIWLPNRLPLIFSHDEDITKAIKNAINYIEHHYVEAKDEYTKKLK